MVEAEQVQAALENACAAAAIVTWQASSYLPWLTKLMPTLIQART